MQSIAVENNFPPTLQCIFGCIYDLLYVFSNLSRNLNFIEHTHIAGWKLNQRARPIIIDPALYLSKKSDLALTTQRRTHPTSFKLFSGVWPSMSTQMNVPRIIYLVVIDDDPTVLEFFKNYCTTTLPIMQSVWYNVTTFLNSGEGWKYVLECQKSKTRIDFIMMETHMLYIDGFAFIDLLNTKHINIPVILMSQDYTDTSQMEAYTLGACDYWKKPVVELHLQSIKGKIMRETMKLKKKRITWTDEMKLQFDEVIKRLGLENAKPKKIHEALNIPGLQVNHVSNHLRTYLKKLKQEQGQQEQHQQEQQQEEHQQEQQQEEQQQ